MYNKGVIAMRKHVDSFDNCQKHIQSLLPPTEWNIEFQNGKIVLV